RALHGASSTNAPLTPPQPGGLDVTAPVALRLAKEHVGVTAGSAGATPSLAGDSCATALRNPNRRITVTAAPANPSFLTAEPDAAARLASSGGGHRDHHPHHHPHGEQQPQHPPPPPPPPEQQQQQQQQQRRQQEQHANIGRATEVLARDLPDFFLPVSAGGTLAGLSDRSIYSPHVVLAADPFHRAAAAAATQRPDRAPHAGWWWWLRLLPPSSPHWLLPWPARLRGRAVYSAAAAALRAACVLAFAEPAVDVVRMVQVRGPPRARQLDDLYAGERRRGDAGPPGEDDGSGVGDGGLGQDAWRLPAEVDDDPDDDAVRLVVRWAFEGVLRHRILFSYLGLGPSHPVTTVYEGVFVYRFDDHGLIDHHRLQSLFPAPPTPIFCRRFRRDVTGSTGSEVSNVWCFFDLPLTFVCSYRT
ncbi:hypothetical protein HK405_007672, partial [Cladochytrium tenue]